MKTINKTRQIMFVSLNDNPNIPYMVIHMDNREDCGSCCYDRTYYLLDMTRIKEPVESFLSHAYFTENWDMVIPDIQKSENILLKKVDVTGTKLPFESITVNNKSNIEYIPSTLHKLQPIQNPIESKTPIRNINLNHS